MLSPWYCPAGAGYERAGLVLLEYTVYGCLPKYVQKARFSVRNARVYRIQRQPIPPLTGRRYGSYTSGARGLELKSRRLSPTLARDRLATWFCPAPNYVCIDTQKGRVT